MVVSGSCGSLWKCQEDLVIVVNLAEAAVHPKMRVSEFGEKIKLFSSL